MEQSDKELDEGLQLQSLFEETDNNKSPDPANNKIEEGKTNISPAPINNKTEEVKINISPEAKNNKTKKGPCPSHVGNGNSVNKKHDDILANLKYSNFCVLIQCSDRTHICLIAEDSFYISLTSGQFFGSFCSFCTTSQLLVLPVSFSVWLVFLVMA